MMAQPNPAGKLITRHHPKSPISEAFRSLRTSLHFLSPNREYRTLLLTSAGPSEGKSTVLSNLAVTLAQSGKRVVIVDADLRRPVQHKVFGLENGTGLTNHLVGENPLDEVIQESGVENLWIITSGPIPPNPSELLEAPRMRSLIQELRDGYDLVLLDSPPVLPITDAAVMASQVDGVLLVIRSGQTRVELAKEAKETIEKSRGKIIGTILNQVRYEGDDYRYYYYYGHDRSRKSKSAQA